MTGLSEKRHARPLNPLLLLGVSNWGMRLKVLSVLHWNMIAKWASKNPCEVRLAKRKASNIKRYLIQVAGTLDKCVVTQPEHELLSHCAVQPPGRLHPLIWPSYHAGHIRAIFSLNPPL